VSLSTEVYRAPNALPYDLETAWSNIDQGTRIRWLTPRFHKVGTVVTRKDRALRVRFDHDTTDTVIPDARWYFTARRNGDPENQLCAVKRSVRAKPSKTRASSLHASHDDLISASQAARDFGVTPKDLRRWLRNGRVFGAQQGTRWMVDEVSLGKYLAERR